MFAATFLPFLQTIGSSVGLSAFSASRNLGGMKLVYAGAILADDGRDSSLFLKGADGTKHVQKNVFGIVIFRDVQLCSFKTFGSL